MRSGRRSQTPIAKTLQKKRKVNFMDRKYTEITENDAKIMYCNCENVYVSTDARNLWKLPASYEYTSHASAEELFYRSVPEYEGKVTFFKVGTKKRIWVCYYINSRGNEMQKIFHDMEEGLVFTQKLDKRIEKGTCGGYSFMEI